jgi:hypothetical protein
LRDGSSAARAACWGLVSRRKRRLVVRFVPIWGVLAVEPIHRGDDPRRTPASGTAFPGAAPRVHHLHPARRRDHRIRPSMAAGEPEQAPPSSRFSSEFRFSRNFVKHGQLAYDQVGADRKRGSDYEPPTDWIRTEQDTTTFELPTPHVHCSWKASVPAWMSKL